MKFLASFFDQIFEQLHLQEAGNSDLTSLLYKRLISVKVFKRKFIFDFISFANNGTEISDSNGERKIVTALDWFFSLSEAPSRSKLNSKIQILAGFNKDCNAIQIAVLGVESSRYFLGEIPIREVSSKNILDKILTIVIEGLERSDQLTLIQSDGLVAGNNLKVEYLFKTNNKRNLRLNIDYDANHKDAQSFDFDLKENMPNGISLECFPAIEKNDICVEFNIANGEVVNTRVFPKFFNQKSIKLTAVSKKGYKIAFNFNSIGSDLNVDVLPTINPYAPFGYLKGNSKNLEVSNSDLDLNYICRKDEKLLYVQ